jgi:hypothetical protein
MYAFLPSLVFRILYIGLWLWLASRGGPDWGLFIIFFATLPVAYLGRDDIRFSIGDALLLIITGMVPVVSVVMSTPVYSSIIGIDKIFHFAGGAAIGLLAYFFFRERIPDRFALAATVVFASLAVGGAWEVFEAVMLVVRHAPAAYYDRILYLDTNLDLVADTLGGMATMAALWLWSKKK